jgi:hypothetical protein
MWLCTYCMALVLGRNALDNPVYVKSVSYVSLEKSSNKQSKLEISTRFNKNAYHVLIDLVARTSSITITFHLESQIVFVQVLIMKTKKAHNMTWLLIIIKITRAFDVLGVMDAQ